MVLPVLVLLAAQAASGPQFEVASIRPESPDVKGRYIRMESVNRFVVRNYTLRRMIAAAYELNLHAVLGGPAWLDSETFQVLATTPGDKRPRREEQMAMLQQLLAERCELQFHREPKLLPAYVLSQAKGGAKLKPTASSLNDAEELVAVVFPEFIRLPARNATMSGLASMMQRGIFDRPVVDQTNLTGRYDFDLEWIADETQYGGAIPKPKDETAKASLYAALQEELGLKLTATKTEVSTLVIDRVEKPSAN